MKWTKFKKAIWMWWNKRDPETLKSLRDYTDQELIDLLEKNESLMALTLAGICSEILRRQLKK